MRPEQAISRILYPDGVTRRQADDHSSRVPVTRYFKQPTRRFVRAALKHLPIWSCTGWGLPSFSGHPKNWCALTAPFHPYPADGEAVCFLLHLPSRRRDSTLWSTLPCGVRTFLRTIVARRSSGLLRPRLVILPNGCRLAMTSLTPMLQKPEGFKVKGAAVSPERDCNPLAITSLARQAQNQDLEFSGFYNIGVHSPSITTLG